MRPSRSANSPRGFSLIEMMAVVAILGLLAAIAMPSISRASQRQRAEVEIRRIADILQDARDRARANLNCVNVTVTPADNRISYEERPDCAAATGTPTKTIDLAPVVTIAPFDTGDPLVFNKTGGTDAATPSSMLVTLTSGGTMRFKVLPAIGAIRELRP